MTSKGVQEPLKKSYGQILNLIIWKFKCYFPLGKRLVIDGKSEIIDGKGVSAPQKRSEVFHCDGCVTYCVTYFMYIDHVYMYLYIESIFVNSSSIFFYSTFFSFFLTLILYIYRRKRLRSMLYLTEELGELCSA